MVGLISIFHPKLGRTKVPRGTSASWREYTHHPQGKAGEQPRDGSRPRDPFSIGTHSPVRFAAREYARPPEGKAGEWSWEGSRPRDPFSIGTHSRVRFAAREYALPRIRPVNGPGRDRVPAIRFR
jgi:CDGSH-type Zn-finger protein